MHILLLFKSYNHTYDTVTGIFLKEQALALSKQNVKVSVVAVNFVSWKDILKQKKLDFGFKKFNTDNINAYVFQTPVIPFYKNINHIRRNVLQKKLFKKLTKEIGLPDIVHAHGFYTGCEALRIKQICKIPYIITEHYSVFARNLVNSYERKIAFEAYKNSNSRIAVSPDFCKLLKQEFNLDFQFLPNIVDINDFQLKNKFNHKKTKFLSIGKLDENKNHKLLIDAFFKLKNNDLELKIIGEGPLKSFLKDYVSTLGLSHQIKFLGSKSKKEVITLFHSSDVFILTSKYETFGIVLIEALSCGLPVITTLNGGVSNLIKDPKLGLISDSNPDELAMNINKIILQEFDHNYIRQFAVNNFSSENIAKSLLQLYQTTINNNEEH